MRRLQRPGPADSHQGLVDEAEFLRTSLEDLDREHAAGELDEDDYRALQARYRQQALDVKRALAATPPVTAEPDQLHTGTVEQGESRRRAGRSHVPPAGARGWLAAGRRRLVIGWAAAGCFVVAAALLGLSLGGVAPFASPPPTTLSVSDQIRIELAEAGVLAANKELVQAVAVYDRVLQLDPEQPEALADGGWLERLAGLSSHKAQILSGGDAEIAAAVRVAPGYALARAYDGIALYDDRHDAAAAVAQFRAMLADRPPATLVASVRSVAADAFAAAHVSLPTALRPPTATSG